MLRKRSVFRTTSLTRRYYCVTSCPDDDTIEDSLVVRAIYEESLYPLITFELSVLRYFDICILLHVDFR